MVDATAAMAAVAKEMAKLRNTYLERLPSELDELAVLAKNLAGNEGDRSSLLDLHQRLHKLAGSGGTFGLTLLSERSRCLEQQAKAWLETPLKHADAESRRRFTEEVVGLSATLAEARTSKAASSKHEISAQTEAGSRIIMWLVEDDQLLGQELVRLLEPFGYEVKLFTQISDAENAAQTGDPDILVMDVLFSQQGENATEVLTHRPGLRELGCPLIFISSQGDFESRVRAARLGAEGYLLKPLDVPRLVDRVEKVLATRRAPVQRVFIVDDDVDLSAHYRLVLLGAGMEVEVLNEPKNIIERLSAFRPELVLMDFHMPDYSGPDLAGVIRQHDNWISLPIVYLSAETDFDRQLHALGRGADDFITKPISDVQLVASVRVRVERARQLADQITKDSLTGLLKHASIKEAAEIEVIRSRRISKPVVLAMVDIDHFKKVNDTYGHAVGDLVIKSIATLLRQRLRQSDIIGRYGGEEFVAVLPGCDLDSARQVLEDIRARFAALQFNHDGKNFNCTLSAGFVCSSQYPELHAPDLLILADQALYTAKREGRNQVRECPPAS